MGKLRKISYNFTLGYFRYHMNLWDIAVIELDSHPDHNRRPDPAPCAGQ